MTIEFYTWSTPNGRKISIALEEFELPYNVHPVNIGQDEQFAPEFVAISPSVRNASAAFSPSTISTRSAVSSSGSRYSGRGFGMAPMIHVSPRRLTGRMSLLEPLGLFQRMTMPTGLPSAL